MQKEGDTKTRIRKILLICAISALVLTGIAVLVGTLFQGNVNENVTVEEVVFLPYQNEKTVDAQTMSYGMAAKYSNGNIGALPYDASYMTEYETEVSTEASGDRTRAQETVFTFTNCGQTGTSGPNQTQINNTYSGTDLDGMVNVSPQGYQNWELPGAGLYTIEVWGAAGNNASSGGGYGTKMKGDFELDNGDKLIILVGQMGTSSYYGGGGGGTYVGIGASYNSADPLIVAGGGGGRDQRYGNCNNMHATTNQNGRGTCNCSSNMSGGTNGNGGQGDGINGGGGGFYGNGGGSYNGIAFRNGGNGGSACQGHGGFGGGGGTCDDAAGGGGGYSGGGACGENGNGGGGGSYNEGDNQENIEGSQGNSGHGKVVITWYGGGSGAEYGMEYEEGTGESYEFTNCGRTGMYGPNQGQMNSEYSGTNLDGQVTWVYNGIQRWTVPQTNTYSITVWGARAGYGTNYNDNGGYGAKMKGDFYLEQGTIIKILVGQRGDDGYGAGGGGGGSYVTLNNNDPLIIAGGGGGGQYGSATQSYQHGTVDQNGQSTNRRNGGTNGSGGQGDTGGGACGGGGLTGNGGQGSYGWPGQSFTNGGNGGNTNYYAWGGFGGGAGTHGNSGGGGGGGGYSGGAGGYHNDIWGNGGGGGSYNDGDNQENEGGENNGHGKVVIETAPVALARFYKEPFTDPIFGEEATEFGVAWGKTNQLESARNQRIMTEPIILEVADYEFTHCGQSGRSGPSQGQINSAYSGTDLAGEVTRLSDGIQQWTIPETLTYTITVWGAKAGRGIYETDNAGLGAKMQGDFELEAGTQLKILVGQKGDDGYGSGGGGGGTYVTLNDNTPLIIAGGGGGGQWHGATRDYQHGTTQESGQNTNRRSGGNNGGGGQGDTGGGACGGGGLTGNGGQGSYGSPGISFTNGGTGGNTSYVAWGGFGGGGGTHGNSGGGGGGGGYSGGAGGYHDYYWGNGGGGGSYNDGGNQDNESGVNQDHGKVTIKAYEELDDPGFDSYEEEDRGPFCWVMDNPEEEVVRADNQNELLLHIGLDAGEEDVTDLSIEFAAEIYGNCEPMPAVFDNGDDPEWDGVAVSTDGENWYKVWSPNAPADWAMYDGFDLLSILPPNSVDSKEDLYIKFMQFGGGTIPDEGILYDEVTLRANPEVEFLFNVPTLSVSLEHTPEDPFRIYAQGQGDPDEALVTINISGFAGGGGMDTRADPQVYEFTHCGATGRYGPSQAQINNAYSGTELDGQVTRIGDGTQQWTVPKSGLYTIEAWGAKGGNGGNSGSGGRGARMYGEFELEEGEVINVMVGQMGQPHTHGGSGGGGTFVVTDSDDPLVIAGGGGCNDFGDPATYSDASIDTSGRQSSTGHPGGTNGNGSPNANGGSSCAGQGAGLLTDGGSTSCGGIYAPDEVAKSYLNGGRGGEGSCEWQPFGGFGGGGGNGCWGSGGGGGYSGGGGGYHYPTAGGGGGSFNDGENQDNEAGVNSDHGKVEISYMGGGDPAASEVRFTYERADGIIIDDDPGLTEIEWSSADANPDDDVVFVGDEFIIEFMISSPVGFAGEIGLFTLQYISWDNEIVDMELESPYLRVQEFAYAEFSDDTTFIANKHGPNPENGNLLTLLAWDDLEPPGEMPPQEYHGWQIDLPTVDSFQLFDTGFSHQKYLHIVGGSPGDQGTITVTHGPETRTGETFEFPITLTSGPATTATVTALPSYMYSMTDILTVAVQDDYGNEAVDWTGKMYISMLDGEVDFSEEVLVEDDGGLYDGYLYYEFTPADRALHTFFITPWTYMGDGDTIIQFETIEGLSAQVELFVDAGPVHHLIVTPDWDQMGVSGRPDNYIYAGETLYIDIVAVDQGDHVSSSYEAPMIVEHNSMATGELEPEPWATETSNIIMGMIDGVITAQDQLTEFIFYKATGDLEINVKSGINHAINGKLDMEVRAGPLAELTPIPDPSVLEAQYAADGRLLIPVSGTQTFDVQGFDQWGNLVSGLTITDWDTDELLGIMDDDMFEAVDYFSLDDNPEIEPGEYSYLDGYVYITAEDTDDFLEGEVTLEIPIRVFNRLNVWVVREEIGATEFLLDTPFELRVPVHYNSPEDSFPDNLQLLVKCTIYHEVNFQGEEQGDGHVIHTSGAPNSTFRLLNLVNSKEGIKEYSVLIPFESMASALNYDTDNADTVNYLKVEILDVPGGADMRDFQWNEGDDWTLTELHAVAAPPASETPSFAPALAFMILALLAGAVIANLYSRNNEKGNRRKKDEDGVSPVIAIILMVAITIVLAGVLWLWVSGLVDTQKSNDIEYVDTAWESPTLQNDYQLIIENVKDKEFSVEDLEFSLMDGNKVDKSMGQHKVTAIYGKSIDNETIVSFHDGDHDGYLSTGDRFIIKSEDHVNYDGTPDPGEARAGYYFALKTKDNELFEVQIEQ